MNLQLQEFRNGRLTHVVPDASISDYVREHVRTGWEIHDMHRCRILGESRFHVYFLNPRDRTDMSALVFTMQDDDDYCDCGQRLNDHDASVCQNTLRGQHPTSEYYEPRGIPALDTNPEWVTIPDREYPHGVRYPRALVQDVDAALAAAKRATIAVLALAFVTLAPPAGCTIAYQYEDGSATAICTGGAWMLHDPDGQPVPGIPGHPVRAPGWYAVS